METHYKLKAAIKKHLNDLQGMIYKNKGTATEQMNLKDEVMKGFYSILHIIEFETILYLPTCLSDMPITKVIEEQSNTSSTKELAKKQQDKQIDANSFIIKCIKDIVEHGKTYTISILVILFSIRQSDAARKLGISTSSFSKKWSKLSGGKRWPHRAMSAITKHTAEMITNYKKGEEGVKAVTKLRNEAYKIIDSLKKIKNIGA